MKFCNKKSAFTLSEVLLTIALIGSLATMTLSTVGSSVQQRARLAEFRTAFSKMSITLRSITSEEGKIYSCYLVPSNTEIDDYGLKVAAGTAAQAGECADLMDAFVRAMGATRFCKDDPVDEGCIPQNYPTAESGCFTNFNGEAYVLDNSMIIFSDGNESLKRFAIDVNGRKGPNRWGQDIFPFSIKATESVRIGGVGRAIVKEVGIFPPAGDGTSCQYIKTKDDGSKKYKASRTTTQMMLESTKGRG